MSNIKVITSLKNLHYLTINFKGTTIENSNVWITGAITDYYTTYLFSITNNSSSTSKDVTLKIYGLGVMAVRLTILTAVRANTARFAKWDFHSS